MLEEDLLVTLCSRQQEGVDVLAGFGRGFISSMSSPNLGRWDPVPLSLWQFLHFALGGDLKLLIPVEAVMLESIGIALGRGIPSSVSILKQELGK